MAKSGTHLTRPQAGGYNICEIPLPQSFAIVRFSQIKRRTDGDDSSRINFSVRHVIVALDVIEVHGLCDTRLLIQIHQITLQVWVISDAPQIALEMAVVDGIEANKRAKKSPVRLDNSTWKEIPTFRQALFEFIERCKNSAARNLVGPLAGGKTRAINAVVYIIIQKTRKLRVFGFDLLRKKIDVFILGELIKYVVEHATNVVLAIVNDPTRLLVPKHRDSNALGIMLGRRFVSFAQELEAVNWIG